MPELETIQKRMQRIKAFIRTVKKPIWKVTEIFENASTENFCEKFVILIQLKLWQFYWLNVSK